MSQIQAGDSVYLKRAPVPAHNPERVVLAVEGDRLKLAYRYMADLRPACLEVPAELYGKLEELEPAQQQNAKRSTEYERAYDLRQRLTRQLDRLLGPAPRVVEMTEGAKVLLTNQDVQLLVYWLRDLG